jgi:hypothetical protein
MRWVGSFVTDEKFSVNLVRNFNPESSVGKMEINFDAQPIIL